MLLQPTSRPPPAAAITYGSLPRQSFNPGVPLTSFPSALRGMRGGGGLLALRLNPRRFLLTFSPSAEVDEEAGSSSTKLQTAIGWQKLGVRGRVQRAAVGGAAFFPPCLLLFFFLLKAVRPSNGERQDRLCGSSDLRRIIKSLHSFPL